MTKTDLVDKLNELGQGTKTELKKLDVPALKAKMEELGIHDELTEDTVEGVTNTIEDSVSATEVKEPELEPKVLDVFTHQLGIFTEFIYHVKNEGATILVENLGNGDAYVDRKATKVGDKATRLLTGEKKVIENAIVVHLIAASQPELKITELE